MEVMLSDGCIYAKRQVPLTDIRHILHSQLEGTLHLTEVIVNLWFGAVEAY